MDGGAGDVAVAVDGSGDFAFPVGSIADGVHIVALSATDGTGNVATTSLGFTLDTQPPTISVTAPAPGSIVDASPTLTGTVVDGLSGVASLEAQVDGGADRAVVFDRSGEFTLPVGPIADGVHIVRLSATDGVGNVATSGLGFTLDTQPPTISVTAPAPGSIVDASPTITGSVSDALSGVATLRAQVDGGAATAVAVDAPGHFSFPAGLAVDGRVDGPHTVELKAADRAGNVTTTSLSFTLDTQAAHDSAGPDVGSTLPPARRSPVLSATRSPEWRCCRPRWMAVR